MANNEQMKDTATWHYMIWREILEEPHLCRQQFYPSYSRHFPHQGPTQACSGIFKFLAIYFVTDIVTPILELFHWNFLSLIRNLCHISNSHSDKRQSLARIDTWKSVTLVWGCNVKASVLKICYSIQMKRVLTGMTKFCRNMSKIKLKGNSFACIRDKIVIDFCKTN